MATIRRGPRRGPLSPPPGLPAASLPAALTLLLTAAPARAGGYDYPAQGTFALSRGGAFAARADNPVAIYYNPAGAARLRGTHILINGNLLWEDVRYQRRIYNDDGTVSEIYPHTALETDPSKRLRMPELQNKDGVFPTPFIAITSDLSVLRPYGLTLMAGLYGPHVHPRRSYPAYCKKGISPCVETTADDKDGVPSPARYDGIVTDVLMAFPSLGLAWEPPWKAVKGLRIGAVFQVVYAEFVHETTAAVVAADDPRWDVGIRIESKDSFTPTGIFGVQWGGLDFLELGVSARVGFTEHFKGRVTTRVPDEMSAFDVDTEGDIETTLKMPWVVRSGVRFIQRDAAGRELFDVELDFVYESTSDVELFDNTATLQVNGQDIQPLPKTYGWDDTFGVRLGGTYNFWELFGKGLLKVSLGGFYESAAMPQEYTRLDFMPMERFGLAGGLDFSWDFGFSRIGLALGYMHIFHVGRTVKESLSRQLVPLFEPDQGKTIGTGSYKVAIDVFSLGLSADF